MALYTSYLSHPEDRHFFSGYLVPDQELETPFLGMFSYHCPDRKTNCPKIPPDRSFGWIRRFFELRIAFRIKFSGWLRKDLYQPVCRWLACGSLPHNTPTVIESNQHANINASNLSPGPLPDDLITLYSATRSWTSKNKSNTKIFFLCNNNLTLNINHNSSQNIYTKLFW